MGFIQPGFPRVINGFQFFYSGNLVDGQTAHGSAELDIAGSYTPLENRAEISGYINGSLGLEGWDVFQDATGAVKIRIGDLTDSEGNFNAINIKRTAVATKDMLGFFGSPEIVQPAAIAAPSGGATIDTQARTAIQAIINFLSEAAGGIGLTA